jgi:hypothetical protein
LDGNWLVESVEFSHPLHYRWVNGAAPRNEEPGGISRHYTEQKEVEYDHYQNGYQRIAGLAAEIRQPTSQESIHLP